MSDTFVIREFNGDDSRLEISDYGAQVLSWAPVGQPSVIWRPSALVLEAGVPIREACRWSRLGSGRDMPAGMRLV